VNIEINKYL